MSESKLRSVCSIMEGFIETARADIARKERELSDLHERIEELQAQTKPNTALIEALQARRDAVRQEIVEARSSLQVLQEEFSASCL